VASSKEVDRVVGVEEIALRTRIIVLSECQSCSAPKKKGRRQVGTCANFAYQKHLTAR
jgi:hypothetical protein